MNLPKVPLLQPVSTAARDAVEYPDAFLSLLAIRAKERGNARASIQMRNFNHSTGEIQPEHESLPWRKEIMDLYSELARVPVLAAAAAQLLAAIMLLRQESDILELIGGLEENADASELIAQLKGLHTEMGVEMPSEYYQYLTSE